jgi:crotonobetainyl-CoA:carnitine CoA-transferase CaiB-like acyl-CoA transferase
MDFTTAWAGPMATRILAHLGAEVVKIESPVHLDSWRGSVRGGAPERFPSFLPGDRPYNRIVNFNTQNGGKKSVALNLKAAGGLEVALRLVEHMDVVVANFSSGVLDRLGLGYAALSAVNPQIIVVEMPAFGRGGPEAGYVGMGMTMEAASGMGSLLGYGNGTPALTGSAYLDPMGGLNASAAITTALMAREQSGRGQFVEVAQVEAAQHWIGEYLLDYLYTGHQPTPCGNQVAYAAPHDAYPCKGEDEWVAIAIRDDVQWAAMCDVIGRVDLAEAAQYAHLPDRWYNQQSLYSEIAAWSMSREKWSAARELQEARVPAAPVANGRDVAFDASLWSARFYSWVDHPEAGRHIYPGMQFRMGAIANTVGVPAPLFGQHNDEVLRGILSMTDNEIGHLRETGAVCDFPDEHGDGS